MYYHHHAFSLQTTGSSATVTCENNNLNPAQLGLLNAQNPDQMEGASGRTGEGKKRRRRSAVFVPHVRSRRLEKRQEDTSENVNDETIDRTLVSLREAGRLLLGD